MGEVEVCIWGINYHEFFCGLGPATRRKQLQDDRAKGPRAGWPLCLPCSLSSLSASALPTQVLGSPGTAPKAQDFPDSQMWNCEGRRETHLAGEGIFSKGSMPSH